MLTLNLDVKSTGAAILIISLSRFPKKLNVVSKLCQKLGSIVEESLIINVL